MSIEPEPIPKEPTRIKSPVTVQPNPNTPQGVFKWSINYADNTQLSKYNADGTKNLYATADGVKIALTNVASISLSNGKNTVTLDVPAGAKVFQRRRAISINYRDKWYPVTQVIPPTQVGNKMLPERTVTKLIPEEYYDQVWIIGWRKRNADNSIQVQFKAVYPDGASEDYTAFGLKPWLYMPEWFEAEKV